MLAVIVDFEIKSDFQQIFYDEMLKQAENSLKKEPGCHYFDVCFDPDIPNNILLYELYEDQASFEVHLKSDHFLSFDAKTSEWISKKTVRLLEKIMPEHL